MSICVKANIFYLEAAQPKEEVAVDVDKRREAAQSIFFFENRFQFVVFIFIFGTPIFSSYSLYQSYLHSHSHFYFP